MKSIVYYKEPCVFHISFVSSGETSPPDNLRNATPDDTPSTTIEWEPPVHTGGNGISIIKYKIVIPDINYDMQENGTAQSHTIREATSGVDFNTRYEAKVTAINTCENESAPTNIFVNVQASGKYTVSTCTHCT